LNDDDLRRLGRLHSAREGLAALDMARRVFDRVSFDLIYARQDQSIAAWQSELDRALSFEPDHLSLYQLTIEQGTAFGDRLDRGKLDGLPDEDLGARLWEVTQEATERAGLPAYEVSNHAKPGEESRHNLIYWQGGDYAGVGPGAHGRLTLDGRRWATDSATDPKIWLQASRSGSTENRSILSESEVFQEKLLMGLRLSDGVVLSDQEKRYLSSNINYLEDLGLVTTDHGSLRLTMAGRPLLNAVLDRLLNG
jgi:oxygen-independent coproporphyrinogen-3 oxidase